MLDISLENRTTQNIYLFPTLDLKHSALVKAFFPILYVASFDQTVTENSFVGTLKVTHRSAMRFIKEFGFKKGKNKCYALLLT